MSGGAEAPQHTVSMDTRVSALNTQRAQKFADFSVPSTKHSMCACMYVCTHISMYSMYVSMFVHIYTYICMYVCMYVCM